jgi:hypothetical protein
MELESKEEYIALLSALTLYANKLYGWCLHYYPWKHGKDYAFAPAARQATPA